MSDQCQQPQAHPSRCGCEQARETDWRNALRAANNHTRTLIAERDALSADNQRLRGDNEALSRNLKGKHELTGATYEHLISERDRLLEALEQAVAEAVADELDPWYANAVAALAGSKDGDV